MGRSIVGSENWVTELAVTKRAIELLKGKVVHRKRTVRGDRGL